MKLSELVPQLSRLNKYEQQLNSITGTLSQIYKSGGADSYRSPTLGMDQLVNHWLRQQAAYRQQLVMDLITIALTVEEVASPVHHIISEVFRKGIQWAPAFAIKCKQCNTEYQKKIRKCKVCDSEDFREPDEKQKEVLDTYLDDANIWDKSLEDLLKGFAWNFNIIDDAFLYLAKEYVEGQGDEVRSKVIEIRNINPALIEFDLDQNGLPKNSHFMCLIHRDTILSTEAGKCPECERNLVPAMYIYRHRGKVVYLFDSEIIHVSKFWPGNETYGWSPILTIFEKVLTIIGMDRMQYRYFWERKVPSGMIFIFTDDVDSIRAERAEMEAKLRMDPSYVPMIGVQSRTNRGRVDMVRLFHTLQEMEYVPVRQEIRERIASMWGVSPIWQGALEASGGIASQTQQLVVMSRVVEGDQRIFHEKVFPQILEAFGVTDWKLELPQPEEMAESTRLQFSLQKISAAMQLSQMGFEVEAISEEGVELADLDFKISGKAKSQVEQQKEMMAFQQEQQQKAQAAMGGGGGGLGGLFGGGGAPDGGIPGQEDEEGSPELPGASEELSEEEPVEEKNEQQQQLPSFLQRAHEKRFFNKLRSNPDMMSDLLQKGFTAPIMKSLSSDGTSMIFESMGKPYVADLEGGRIVNISKYSPPALHQHNGMPLHSISMQHNQTSNINDTKKIPEQMLKELESGD